MAADALSEALARADEHGPWVLASAGIGSVYARIFSSRHGREVSGILLIDPLPSSYLDGVGDPWRGFRHWLRGVLSPLGWDRVPAAVFRGRTKEDRVYGRSAYQSGKFQFAKLQENLVARSYTRREVDNSGAIQYKDTPLVVVSSGVMIKGDAVWERGQQEIGKEVTDNLVHWDVVDGAPHEVWDILAGRQVIEKRLRQLVMGH